MNNKQILDKLLIDFKRLLLDNIDISPCDLCKHSIHEQKCNVECVQYQEGIGCYDSNGKKLDWKWTCMDWEFGTCPVLENTPCHNCWQTDFSNWKYNPNHKEITNE